MFRRDLPPGRFIGVAALLAATSLVATADPIVVSATVTTAGPLYHYAYVITNNTADDLILVDIPVPMDPMAVFDIVAPAGFTNAFDSGLGLVSFLEDSSFFTASPTGGFSFDSPDGPAASIFDGTLLGGGGLYDLKGPTTSPAMVPEPGYALVCAIALGALAALLHRRRKMRALFDGETPTGE